MFGGIANLFNGDKGGGKGGNSKAAAPAKAAPSKCTPTKYFTKLVGGPGRGVGTGKERRIMEGEGRMEEGELEDVGQEVDGEGGEGGGRGGVGALRGLERKMQRGLRWGSHRRSRHRRNRVVAKRGRRQSFLDTHSGLVASYLHCHRVAPVLGGRST